MKKILSLFAVAAVVLGMASCGDGNEPADETKVNPNVGEYYLLPGTFTIGDGVVAQFSQGNLQYNPNEGEGGTWRFATNQWDVVGKNQSPWRDLFGWSTGQDPTKSTASYSDYDSDVLNDWGENVIANGGKNTKHWKTLSQAQWNYLLAKRANASEKFGLGKVAGVNGLIILPNSWTAPVDAPAFNPSPLKGMTYNETWYRDINNKNHFADNTYSKEEWDFMEKAGAIFLPAAGQRDPGHPSYNEVSYVGAQGAYWSSDRVSASDAYCLYFMDFKVDPTMESQFQMGYSVRLANIVEIN